MPRPKKQPQRPAPRKTATKKTPAAPVAQSVGLGDFMEPTRNAWTFLAENRGLFLRTILVFWVTLVAIVGISQQAEYQSIRSLVDLYSADVAPGFLAALFESGVLTLSVLGGSPNASFSAAQQLLLGFVALQVWLVTIWLLRHRLAGMSATVRDGLYNGSAALVPLVLVALVGVLQLLPFALSAVAVSTLGAIWQGAVFTIVAPLLVAGVGIVTVYWLLGTLLAGVIVTIPGTYPWAALRSARQLIKGMRAQLFGRLLWLAFICALASVVLVAFVVGVGELFGAVGSVIAIALIQLIGLVVAVYALTYLYLVYRKVVDVRS